MTEVADAEALILAHMPSLGSSDEPLSAAPGRFLARAVRAERDQPPFDRVTMDGIAICHRDWAHGVREFDIAGTQAAGAPPLRAGARQCIEIMTGAMLPLGTDTIVPVERIERRDGRACIVGNPAVVQGQNIHARGSDRRAGDVLVEAGTRVGGPEMAVLASAGCARVELGRLARVAVVATGDELVDVDEPLEPYQIRSSNDRAIQTSLERHALAAVTRVRLADEARAMLDALTRLHEEHDVLVLSGGVSMGQFDFVPAVLERLGAELVFHRVAQRPGKPIWFGKSRAGKAVFALPGNPVSTMVCLTRYVLPALRQASGAPPGAVEKAVLAGDVQLQADLTHFMPVKLSWSDTGAALAEPRPTNTSGDFVSLAGTDGFVELPRERKLYRAGDVVRLFRW